MTPTPDADADADADAGAQPGTGAGSWRGTAEAAWRWVLDQVRWDDGPWIPWSLDGTAPVPQWDRDGVHSGVGGLAHVLAEVRLTRPWSEEESALATAIGARLRSRLADTDDCSFFDGLAGTVGALAALGEPGVETALQRLDALANPDGWPQTTVGPPRYLPGTRVNDATLGTAGVLLAAVWALRPESGQVAAVAGVARAVADRAADVLLSEGEDRAVGRTWRFVPVRFRADGSGREMPNFSHGLAGIVAALAAGGAQLGRRDLTDAARSGAEHLVTLGSREYPGFVVPREVPPDPEGSSEAVTWNWCHGPAGTSYAFTALAHAGVAATGGEPPATWTRRCLAAVRSSGVPARLRPGFWDNDGRCCGTAGVADVFLDGWHRDGDEDDRRFAGQLADTLVERALVDGTHACWRFLEHRAADPLLPPGVGWMQGAAGIAALLFKAARLVPDRTATVVPRMETWWSLGAGSPQTGTSSTAPTA